MKGEKNLYAQIILPIKFTDAIFYSIGQQMLCGTNRSPISAENLVGKRVKVNFANKKYIGVIYKIFNSINITQQIKPIEQFDEQAQPVSPLEIKFWETIAEYYMCTIGEVFKAAYPSMGIKQESVKSKLTPSELFKKIGIESSEKKFPQINLTPAQQRAFQDIKAQLNKKCVLLNGVTGSGKTEIYISLAKDVIASGKNVLYLVPEIAMSKQLKERIKEHFGERLLPYHSNLTQAKKKLVRDVLQFQSEISSLEGKSLESIKKEPVVILGTRSAIFLPFSNLGLIIVDEEHDSSYKQQDPAPRYNGNNAALFLSKIYNSKVLLGSATPSLETLYNCSKGLYAKVNLTEKYFKSPQPTVIVIDTLYARKTSQMKGSFSQGLINRIQQTLEKGEQALIFSHLRSYSPFVICGECGEILRCPHCNVPLSYHKFSNLLTCHYCEFKTPFKAEMICPNCKGTSSLKLSGAGSEKIEEELKSLFPDAKIARYDADVAQRSVESEKVLKAFADAQTDILVGTQMITKGFDFDNVTLVAVVQTDTLLAQQDFRADEKALSLLTQLMGRCGRREKRGLFIVQTNSKHHPVIQVFEKYSENLERENGSEIFIREREMFHFPPYIRLINITLRNTNLRILNEESEEVVKALKINLGNALSEITGPYTPKLEKLNNFHQRSISMKLERNRALQTTKRNIFLVLNSLHLKSRFITDVDPL